MPVSDLHIGFAVALFRAVPAGAGGNVVVSPWSVSSALAVLAAGVDDQARREIERALAAGADGGPDDLVSALAADADKVAHHRSPGDESVLAVANALWVDVDRTPVPNFVRQLDRWPGAALHFAPIGGAPEKARAAINADVAETTRDLIPEILPKGSLTQEDRAVIVNALYLLAGWFERFDADRSADEPFHGPAGTRDLPTLRAWREAPYARDGWEYIELPLWLDLRAEILLPPDAATTDGLDATRLVELRRRASVHRVDLHLPRLRIEWDADVIPVLRSLGVNRIFDAGARSVHAVINEENLWVSGVFHAAVLRVDERGIEGAAATAIVARGVAYRQVPVVEMRVDRPFYFLVTHRSTGAVLFVAHVAEPQS